MTNLGKTLFAVAAVGLLVSVTLAYRGEAQPAEAAQLTPAQRAELQRPPAPPKAEPAPKFEPPPHVPAPDDGDGS